MKCTSKAFIMILSIILVLLLTVPLNALAGPVPDTGQTQNYTSIFGEDSDYSINTPSYTKLDENGNDLDDNATSWAMVRDNVTGLIWEAKTDDGSIHDKANAYNWYDAQDIFINELNTNNFGGHSDWRIPTVKELSFIVNSGEYSPAINTGYFPNTISSSYWTFTTFTNNPDQAHVVDFSNGSVYYYGNKPSSHYVRAVRGGHSSNSFTINGDGTVSDTSTGLMWQQAPGNTMNWETALDYCESLTLAGYDDWRLPNRNELQSIVNYANINPAIDTTAFPNTISSYYWSSTSYSSYSVNAWQVYFGIGIVEYADKWSSLYVRAVRGGPSELFGDLVISVIDAGSGGPVPYADVVIEDINHAADPVSGVTDVNGRVEFSNLPLGEYQIEIEAAGYLPHSDTISIRQPGVLELQYSLTPCDIYYRDVDQDGYGQDNDSMCLAVPDPTNGYTTQTPGDCEDNNATIHPDAAELCDEIDNNCNGVIDEGCATGKLTGRVFNLLTGQPLPRVRIKILDGSSGITDLNGEYTINGIATGPQEIRFMKRGYFATVLKKIFFTPARTLVIDVGLQRRPL